MRLYEIDLSPTYGKTPETQRPIYTQKDVDEWIFDGVLVLRPPLLRHCKGCYCGTDYPLADRINPNIWFPNEEG